MKKDWNAEWEMEQTEVDDLIESMKTFQACDHAWIPAEEAEPGTALSWIEFICEKCGGAQMKPFSPEAIEALIDDEPEARHATER